MDILKNYFVSNNIDYTDNQIAAFSQYFELLIEWNKKFNLTAITDCADVQIKHFIDSLAALNILTDTGEVVDVGAGAGFPSIPLAIMRPNVQFTLIDSLNKRINFLKEVVAALNLQNITIHHSRAEDFAIDNRSRFDFAIARALAPMNILLEYLAPLVKRGGKVIAYKGGIVDQELETAARAISILRLSAPQVIEFALPTIDDKRFIAVFDKVGECNPIYPRGGNKPRMQPL